MKKKFTNPLFEEILANVPKDISYEVDYLFDISGAIYDTLREHKLSQSDFAKLMGKKDAEISRWLQGTHNFTINTLAKISAVLKTDILKKAFSTEPFYKLLIVNAEPQQYEVNIFNDNCYSSWKKISHLQSNTKYSSVMKFS